MPDSQVYLASRILTNDEIKALPTTAIQVVPAPGEGRMLLWLAATYKLDTTAGAYTVDAGSSWQVMLGTQEASGVCLINSVMLQTAVNVGRFPIDAAPGTGDFSGLLVAGFFTKAASENQPLLIKDDWSGVPNYTDGNAANTLQVHILYSVIDV